MNHCRFGDKPYSYVMTADEPKSDVLLKAIIALVVLSMICLAMALFGCASGGANGDKEAGRPAIIGADVSALAVFEKNAATYRYPDGVRGDAIAILRGAGMNCFRLRLFVNPTGTDVEDNDIEYTLALAKRIKASGAKFMLDIHYSDTWADPAKQTKPAAWKDLDFNDLQAQVESYTADTLKRFIAENAAPDYVQLGNEVTNGMLWPDGRIEFAEASDSAAFDRFAALQAASHKGLDEAFAGRPAPLVVMHIESSGNLARTRWFIDNAATRGIRYDILAFSYYPNWHGTMAELAATLAFAAEKSGKPVIVAETAEPWKLTANWRQYPKKLEFPPTIKGQREFAAALAKTVREVPGGRGIGIMWWYPEAVLNDHINVWLGGDCGLFDRDGTILPTAHVLCGE